MRDRMKESMQETLEAHLSEGESVLESFVEETDQDEVEHVAVVTDKRLLRVIRDGTGKDRVKTVRSILLQGPRVLGAQVEIQEGRSFDGPLALLGGFFGLVGLGMIAAGGSSGGETAALLGIAGLGVIAISGVILYKAISSSEGTVGIEILMLEDSEEVELPAGATPVAEKVSEVIGRS